jgi:hypothetical protein
MCTSRHWRRNASPQMIRASNVSKPSALVRPSPLWSGVIALPYYLDTNPVIVAMARRQIDEVLADRKRTC